jgi:hypothetical protein
MSACCRFCRWIERGASTPAADARPALSAESAVWISQPTLRDWSRWVTSGG